MALPAITTALESCLCGNCGSPSGKVGPDMLGGGTGVWPIIACNNSVRHQAGRKMTKCHEWSLTGQAVSHCNRRRLIVIASGLNLALPLPALILLTHSHSACLSVCLSGFLSLSCLDHSCLPFSFTPTVPLSLPTFP